MSQFQKSIFQNMDGGSQLLLFMFFTFGSFFITVFLVGLATIPFAGDTDIMNNTSYLKLAQFIQATGIFILPSLIFANLFYAQPCQQLGISKIPKISPIIWTLVLVVLCQPILLYTTHLNELMTLPESMKGLELWMQKQEKDVEKVLELFIADKSILAYISNLFIIGVMAGISEELFFRGCLQNIFKKIFKNKHIAIWITSIIFSAIHLQFYGFVPRVLAGALLGYLYVGGGSLILPIIAHITHNGISILIAQFYFGTPKYDTMKNLSIDKHLWIVIVSICLLTLTILFLNKKKIFDNRAISK